MNLQEIVKRRFRIRGLLRQFRDKGFNGKSLAEEYGRLTELFEQQGGKPRPLAPEQTIQYWENPEHYKNEHLNKYPIMGFKDGKPIRSYAPVANKVLCPRLEVANPQTNQVESNYYRINIVWEGIIDQSIIDKFFNEMCIGSIKKQGDDSVSCTYKGGEEGFKILKRSLTVMLNMLCPNNNVAVYGKKIKK